MDLDEPKKLKTLSASFHLDSRAIEYYPLKNSAILDSSTTIHIFNNADRFTNLRSILPGDFIWAGDTKVPMYGYSTVDIRVIGPQGASILWLFNVAYYLTMACNLVSLRHLRKRGL